MMNEHHGLEINRWFDVELPKSGFFAKVFVGYFYILKKIFKVNRVESNLRVCEDFNKPVLFAFKQNIKYYDPSYNIRFKVCENEISEKNKLALMSILEEEAVFVHVRKGDYTSERYRARYEGTCPIEYYRDAIKLIQSKVKTPSFYCFSDDIEWVKKNLGIEAKYIDWNKGEDSPLDMYLMSKCKYAIIANSTFSYWGALLGEKKKIVTYPLKWENSEAGIPDIFPEDWIGIN